MTEFGTRLAYLSASKTLALELHEEPRTMEWIIVIVLVVLLLAAVGPRAGWYGAASGMFDILSLLVLIALVIWLLDVFGVIQVFG